MRAFRGIAAAVIAFGIAFGYLEAAVVVYLRAVTATGPVAPPLEWSVFGSYADVEVGRELATLVMIAAVGWLAGRSWIERLAWAAVVFGTWDLVYYGGLRAIIGWPATLDAWDVLFLVPSPWVGPVWAPMAVSVALVTVGLGAARRCRAGHGITIGAVEIAAGLAGGAAVIGSFLLDAGRVTAGDAGPWSGWPLFWAGMVAAALAALRSLRRPVIAVGPAIPER